VPAASLTGTVPAAALPANVVTNTETGVTLGGTFSGGGGGLTNLNAAQLTSGVISNSVLPNFQAIDNYASIGGGIQNTSSASYAVVGGGNGNTASGLDATVSGGNGNTADNSYATVVGGQGNIASGLDSTAIGFGANASGEAATAIGSFLNASGNYSVALNNNTTASGVAATAMGQSSTASGNFSLAAGYIAQATNNGAFVWSDNSSGSPFGSTNNNSFSARAAGGFQFYTSVSGRSGAGLYVAPGGNSWVTVSDRNAKKDFAPVDYQAVLDKLAQVPIEQWHYKWESDRDTPNIGPMAQDFIHAFYPGRDDKGISTLEFDGVELAAIRGLNQKLEEQTKEKDAEIQDLKQSVDELKKLVQSLAEKK
jgi:hypothetical protein